MVGQSEAVGLAQRQPAGGLEQAAPLLFESLKLAPFLAAREDLSDLAQQAGLARSLDLGKTRGRQATLATLAVAGRPLYRIARRCRAGLGQVARTHAFAQTASADAVIAGRPALSVIKIVEGRIAG